MLGHTGVRQENDEYFCPACGKRWAVDDPEPPNCPNQQPDDLSLLFRMMLSAENYHPQISKYLKPKAKIKFDKWKRERLNAAMEGQTTEG